MSTKKSRRQVLTGVGVAAGAVLAAAMIPVATAPTARADLDDFFGISDEPDLFTDEQADFASLSTNFRTLAHDLQVVTQNGLNAVSTDLADGHVGLALTDLTNVFQLDGFYLTTVGIPAFFVYVPDMVLFAPLADAYSIIP